MLSVVTFKKIPSRLKCYHNSQPTTDKKLYFVYYVEKELHNRETNVKSSKERRKVKLS